MEILGCRKSRITGRAIANKLHAAYIEERPRDSVILRYGNSYSPDGPGLTLNKQEAVCLTANKPLCKQKLLESGIRTPKYYSFREALSGNVRFPVIVRKNNHSQGRWFYVVDSIRKLRRYDPSRYYIQEVVQKIDEYRLFIMNDRIIEADLKELPTNNPHAMIRNHRYGSFFRWVRVSSLDSEMKSMVRRAVTEVVGLDFAAVDCATIQTEHGVSSTIFEINSAPGLNDRKLDLFIRKINEFYEIS